MREIEWGSTVRWAGSSDGGRLATGDWRRGKREAGSGKREVGSGKWETGLGRRCGAAVTQSSGAWRRWACRGAAGVRA